MWKNTGVTDYNVRSLAKLFDEPPVLGVPIGSLVTNPLSDCSEYGRMDSEAIWWEKVFAQFTNIRYLNIFDRSSPFINLFHELEDKVAYTRSITVLTLVETSFEDTEVFAEFISHFTSLRTLIICSMTWDNPVDYSSVKTLAAPPATLQGIFQGLRHFSYEPVCEFDQMMFGIPTENRLIPFLRAYGLQSHIRTLEYRATSDIWNSEFLKLVAPSLEYFAFCIDPGKSTQILYVRAHVLRLPSQNATMFDSSHLSFVR